MKSEMAHSAEIKKSYFSLLFWYEKGIFHPGFSKSLLILFRRGGGGGGQECNWDLK